MSLSEPQYSNYQEAENTEERPCRRCHGTGLVYIQDEETDCMDCEGWGSVLVAPAKTG
jgi:DnaJ-class molecular chaperone